MARSHLHRPALTTATGAGGAETSASTVAFFDLRSDTCLPLFVLNNPAVLSTSAADGVPALLDYMTNHRDDLDLLAAGMIHRSDAEIFS